MMTSHFGGVGGGVGPGQDQRSQEEKGERTRTYTSVTDDRRKFYNDLSIHLLFVCCLYPQVLRPVVTITVDWALNPQLPICPQGLIASVSSCTDSAPPTQHTVQHGSSTAAATRPPPCSAQLPPSSASCVPAKKTSSHTTGRVTR